MALQDLTPQLRTRLSRMERAVGWFVVLAMALLAFGFVYYVYHTAENKGWFLTKAPYYTYADRATGLKIGDPVMLMGLAVGQITRMEPMPPEEFHHNIYVEFHIKAPYYGYLWTEGSRATSSAMRTLSILAKLTCGVASVPASFMRPRCRATNVARCTLTIMSTSFFWVSWNDAIGRSNCRRSSEYASADS